MFFIKLLNRRLRSFLTFPVDVFYRSCLVCLCRSCIGPYFTFFFIIFQFSYPLRWCRYRPLSSSSRRQLKRLFGTNSTTYLQNCIFHSSRGKLILIWPAVSPELSERFAMLVATRWGYQLPVICALYTLSPDIIPIAANVRSSISQMAEVAAPLHACVFAFPQKHSCVHCRRPFVIDFVSTLPGC